jgi:hypothetical protein
VITMAETKINIQELNQLKNPTKTPDGLWSILGFLSYSQHTHLVEHIEIMFFLLKKQKEEKERERKSIQIQSN